MVQICVFAGTTEGRMLAGFLAQQPVRAIICVATEYGETLIPESGNLEIRAGRMSQEEMVSFFQEHEIAVVIDATHPYAAEVSANLSSACEECHIPYGRLLREESDAEEGVFYVPDTEAAQAFLDQTEGNILLTTGSKELHAYQKIHDFTQRVYARVLPMESSLQACRDAGLKPAHILAMQGPFTEELNIAMLHGTKASWMVTKDGGDPGGFREKLAAARKAGVKTVVIGRPGKEKGLTYSAMITWLCREYGCRSIPDVSIVGIGPGSREQMTVDAIHALEQADCLIGAGRMILAAAHAGQQTYEAIAPEKINGIIREHPEYSRFAVVMSGDTGFFSGTKKLLPLLKDCHVRVFPGISSLSYLCARLGESYDDVHLISLHGREHDIIPDVRRYSRIFVLVGGAKGINHLCSTLVEAGLGHVRIHIGERLSYPEERITSGTAEELMDGAYDPLCAALLEHSEAQLPAANLGPGLPDTAFIRGGSEEGVVPMTKSEIRAISLSKLQIPEDAVCWDVGAGTGSVSIEMALQARCGSVYAIEKKEAAVSLLEQNKAAFHAENLRIVCGSAPEALEELPAPTHVFIGGSSGNMREILTRILAKNPSARIVATAIALETMAELTECLRRFPFAESEVISVNIARDRKAGPYHLMNGQNPITIFTMQGKHKDPEQKTGREKG